MKSTILRYGIIGFIVIIGLMLLIPSGLTSLVVTPIVIGALIAIGRVRR